MSAVTGDTSDGYHTFNELYAYREAFNAALFNEWYAQGKYKVHKSWRHSDGELCFGGGWFIVVAELPTGQISNHYPVSDWHDFIIPRREIPAEWDGHTPQEALDRLKAHNQHVRYKVVAEESRVTFWVVEPDARFLYAVPLHGRRTEEVISQEGFTVTSDWQDATLMSSWGYRQTATIEPRRFS